MQEKGALRLATPMARKTKPDPLPEECFSDTDTFNIQVYKDDGTLINEYDLDLEKDGVPSMAVAKIRALKNLGDNCEGRVVIIVSGETMNKLQQVQIDVDLSAAGKPAR